MINVTDVAIDNIMGYFQGKEPTPIRIFVNSGGWVGPSLALALDELKDTDNSYEIKGVTLVIDKKLMVETETIDVDFTGLGFKITSKIDINKPDSTCNSCSSCKD